MFGFGEDSGPGIGDPQGPLWEGMRKNWIGWDQLLGRPNDPRLIVALVIKGFMSLLSILFLCLVVYAGVTWMTAAGDEEKIKKAKSTLVTGVIGMLVILAAFSIAHIVVIAFGCATSNYGAWCLFFNDLTY